MVYLSRHEHYSTKKPKSKKKEYRFQVNLYGMPLEFVTSSGIFSPRMLDLGALTLITFMELKKNSKILDLGCGYGPVGIAAAKMCSTCHVTLVDINERAVWCTKKNVELNNVKNAKVKQSFMFSGLKNEMFDLILLNPPISEGMETCYEMINESFDHIEKGGKLQLVAKNRKGGERLLNHMEELFGNVEVLGKKGGFWVYSSTKKV